MDNVVSMTCGLTRTQTRFPHRWLGHTLVGTTDAPSAAETRPTAPEDEVQWLLNECSRYLSPDVRVSRKDVLSAWRGWRPLARDPHVGSGVRTKRPRRPARPQL
jgi:glycerol-3-phosphate dehydrogenase